MNNIPSDSFSTPSILPSRFSPTPVSPSEFLSEDFLSTLPPPSLVSAPPLATQKDDESLLNLATTHIIKAEWQNLWNIWNTIVKNKSEKEIYKTVKDFLFKPYPLSPTSSCLFDTYLRPIQVNEYRLNFSSDILASILDYELSDSSSQNSIIISWIQKRQLTNILTAAPTIFTEKHVKAIILFTLEYSLEHKDYSTCETLFEFIETSIYLTAALPSTLIQTPEFKAFSFIRQFKWENPALTLCYILCAKPEADFTHYLNNQIQAYVNKPQELPFYKPINTSNILFYLLYVELNFQRLGVEKKACLVRRLRLNLASLELHPLYLIDLILIKYKITAKMEGNPSQIQSVLNLLFPSVNFKHLLTSNFFTLCHHEVLAKVVNAYPNTLKDAVVEFMTKYVRQGSIESTNPYVIKEIKKLAGLKLEESPGLQHLPLMLDTPPGNFEIPAPQAIYNFKNLWLTENNFFRFYCQALQGRILLLSKDWLYDFLVHYSPLWSTCVSEAFEAEIFLNNHHCQRVETSLLSLTLWFYECSKNHYTYTTQPQIKRCLLYIAQIALQSSLFWTDTELFTKLLENKDLFFEILLLNKENPEAIQQNITKMQQSLQTLSDNQPQSPLIKAGSELIDSLTKYYSTLTNTPLPTADPLIDGSLFTDLGLKIPLVKLDILSDNSTDQQYSSSPPLVDPNKKRKREQDSSSNEPDAKRSRSQ